MTSKYRHTNIISDDWQRLADFYCAVFECMQSGPARQFSGPSVSLGTGVVNAIIEGIHLQLPGSGENPPTLEIFKYNETIGAAKRRANTVGYGHIAFEVDSVREKVREVVEHGGSLEGQIVAQQVAGVGVVEFVYVRDPDGNLIELQSWAPGITTFHPMAGENHNASPSAI